MKKSISVSRSCRIMLATEPMTTFTRMSGYFASTTSSRRGTIRSAAEGPIPNRTRPLTPAAAPSKACSSAVALKRRSSARASNCLPTGVRTAPVRLRSNRVTRYCRSSAWMLRLSAGWDRWSASAALMKLPVCASTTKW